MLYYADTLFYIIQQQTIKQLSPTPPKIKLIRNQNSY